MKKIIFISISFIIINSVFAQTPTFQWAKGTEGWVASSSVAVDINGNVYTTGFFTGTVDFDPGPGISNLVSAGNNDIFIRRQDASGNFSWAHRIGNSGDQRATSIAVDNIGNAYITGYFGGLGNCDFDPGFAVYNLNNAASGQYDIFVLKLDASGNFVWAKQMGDAANSADMAYSIAVDNIGNVYTTGSFTQTSNFDPNGSYLLSPPTSSPQIFVSKLNSNGNFVWAKQLGGTGFDEAHSITVDNNGNVYTTGYFQGIADFDPGTGTANLTSIGGWDIFVSKLDSSGNFVWAKQIGTNSDDDGKDIAVDNNGNVHTTGFFNGTADFDPGVGVFNLTSSMADAFVSKLDSLGNFIWAKQIEGTGSNQIGSSITLGDSGNVYTSGYFYGTSDFDPGASTYNFTSAGDADVFISKLDTLGNFIWAGQVGATSLDAARSMVFSNGSIYTTGEFIGTVDFDPGPGTFNINASSGTFVLKLLDCTTISSPSSISGEDTVCAGSSQIYSVMNDPTATSYTWTLPGGWSGTSATNSITTIAGSTGGNISVVANNSCGSSSASILPVTVNSIPANPGTISGNTLVCLGANNLYSVTPVSGAVSYTWTLPPGWGGSSASDSIITSVGSSTGNITVTANNSCGSSSPSSLTILNVWTIPANPGTMFGATTVCEGSSHLYNVAFGSMTTSYTWTLPSGWSGTPMGNAIDAIAGPTGGVISVTANNLCGTSTPSLLTVTVNTIPVTPGIIVGPDTICEGSTNNYSVTVVGGATSYSWGLPFGWSGSSTANSINTTASSASGSISVTANNSCGNSAPQTLAVTVNALPAVMFTYPGADTICIDDGIQTLSGGTPSGGTYSGTGVTGTSFDPNSAGVGNHIITYNYTDGNNCTNSDIVAITIIGCTGIEDNMNETIVVYPNPFTNSITINGIETQSETVLYNTLGEVIRKWIITETNNSINTENLRSGVYFIKINSILKKIIKQ